MRESIVIKNLGPLTDTAIADIRPLTVLIGPSGSGKSLLMKATAMMRYIYKRANVRAYLLDAGLKKSPFRFRMDSIMRDDMKYYLSQPGAHIEYHVEMPSGNTYSVVFSKGKINVPKSIAPGDLLFTKESWVSESRNVIPSWRANPANAKGSLGFYFHETLNDFEEAVKALDHIALGFIGANISVARRGSNQRIMLECEGRHRPIELRYASSGMQTVTPLAMLASYFADKFSFREAKKRSVLSYLYDSDQLAQFHPSTELSEVTSIINMHIEEPELSLDPVAQTQLLDFLVQKTLVTNNNSMTMMLATHSPYIVNALNLIINRQSTAASLPVADVAAFRLHDGTLINLASSDYNGNHFIDTADMTQPMENILDEYQRLTQDVNMP